MLHPFRYGKNNSVIATFRINKAISNTWENVDLFFLLKILNRTSLIVAIPKLNGMLNTKISEVPPPATGRVSDIIHVENAINTFKTLEIVITVVEFISFVVVKKLNYKSYSPKFNILPSKSTHYPYKPLS